MEKLMESCCSLTEKRTVLSNLLLVFMSKYRGPRLRVVRRLGELPAFTKKTPTRNTRPGQHGASRRKPTQFAYRLREKQKLRFYYGVSEKKLTRYVKIARRTKGDTETILLNQLEIRLDNILFRLGWAPTLPAARQLVNHGNIKVEKRLVTIPSFSCSPGQIITLRDGKTTLRTRVKQAMDRSKKDLPIHLSMNTEGPRAILNSAGTRCEVPFSLNALLIIEYYSNRLLMYRIYGHIYDTRIELLMV